jgi:hypothetical protein
MFPHQNLCAFLFFLTQVPYWKTSLFWVITRRVVENEITTTQKREVLSYFAA